MPLYMEVEGIRCFQEADVQIWRDTVADTPEIMTEWLEGFYASNGKKQGAMAEVDTWLRAPTRISFQQIASHLIQALAPHVALNTVDLVVVAHWTPDCVMGGSVTNFILHRIEADHAYAFAVSDCGLTAPFQALSLIDRYLPPHQGKALLVCLDQPLLLHPTACFRQDDAKASGVVMWLDRQPTHDGFELAPYASVDAVAPTYPSQAPSPNEKVVVIGTPPSELPPDAVIATLTPDAARLSTAPFYALSEYLRANPDGPTVLLSIADKTQRHAISVAKRASV